MNTKQLILKRILTFCIVILLLVAFWFLYRCFVSLPLNSGIQSIAAGETEAASFLCSSDDSDVYWTSGTQSREDVEKVLGFLKDHRYWLGVNRGSAYNGQDLAVHIYMRDRGSFILRLRKGENAAGTRTASVSYDGEEYYIELFSDGPEIALYDSVYTIASGLPRTAHSMR